MDTDTKEQGLLFSSLPHKRALILLITINILLNCLFGENHYTSNSRESTRAHTQDCLFPLSYGSTI